MICAPFCLCFPSDFLMIRFLRRELRQRQDRADRGSLQHLQQQCRHERRDDPSAHRSVGLRRSSWAACCAWAGGLRLASRRFYSDCFTQMPQMAQMRRPAVGREAADTRMNRERVGMSCVFLCWAHSHTLPVHPRAATPRRRALHFCAICGSRSLSVSSVPSVLKLLAG